MVIFMILKVNNKKTLPHSFCYLLKLPLPMGIFKIMEIFKIMGIFETIKYIQDNGNVKYNFKYFHCPKYQIQ